MNGQVVASALRSGTSQPGNPRAASVPLTVRVVPWSEAVQTEWRSLERGLADVPLAATADWTAAWLHVYGDQVNARVAIAEQDGRVRGIALLAESRQQRVGPCRLSTLHLGTSGEADGDSACVEYNGLLVDPAVRAEFAGRLIDLAVGQHVGDELRLDGFDEASAGAVLPGLPRAEVTTRVSRYFDLAAARASNRTVMERLGSSTRSALRRALKKTGELEVTQARSLDDADDYLTELIELHQARWTAGGQPGAFASERFTRFQRELIARLLPDERIVLLRVCSRSMTIGCLLLLVDRGRLLDYVSGFASFDETPSPGIVTHYLAMEWALARGDREYDFLVGDKRHKANLATDARNLVWAVWRRPSWKNRAIAGLRSAKRAWTERRGRKCVASGEAE